MRGCRKWCRCVNGGCQRGILVADDASIEKIVLVCQFLIAIEYVNLTVNRMYESEISIEGVHRKVINRRRSCSCSHSPTSGRVDRDPSPAPPFFPAEAPGSIL